jgi:hypothetical protein
VVELNYADMLSGDPIFIKDLGHIRSPKLKDLAPSSGIGFWMYNFYLNFLSWNKDDFIKYVRLAEIPYAEVVAQEKFILFDSITLLDSTRELFMSILGLFFIEEPIWDEHKRVFYICKKETDKKERFYVGCINRDNFEEVRKIILKFNYIGIDEEPETIKYSSETAKIWWEKSQEFLAKQNKSAKNADGRRYDIGNIISKLCVVHPSYNLLNIYDLTAFQLYDQFLQYGYLRAIDFGQEIYSNHGGDNFDFEKWIDPVNKLSRG